MWSSNNNNNDNNNNNNIQQQHSATKDNIQQQHSATKDNIPGFQTSRSALMVNKSSKINWAQVKAPESIAQ